MYAQLLIAASFAAASYQDLRERAVNDLIWIPGAAGAAYVVYWFFTHQLPSDTEFFLLKVALVGGVGLVFTLIGGIGEADAIAMALVAADPWILSPFAPLIGAAVIAISHIGYEFAVGNARGTKTVPMEQFLKEQRWIPKAIIHGGERTEVSADVNVAREEVESAGKREGLVEVKYGVPTVTYIGAGYLAYIVYLLVANPGVFASLP